MKAWNNLKIGVRIIMSFLIVIALTGAVGIIGITSLSKVKNAMANLERVTR